MYRPSLPEAPTMQTFIAGHRLVRVAQGLFDDTYRRSLEEREAFWADAAAAIDWDEPWERVLDDSRAPFYRWFAGGRMNTCHNALDRHVERGRGDQPALTYDSPVTETVVTFTYAELRDAVARFAGALAAQGVERGDRVIVYMPMVPEAVIAMLACARLGAIHSVVFGGFAASELATRIEDARPSSTRSETSNGARRSPPRGSPRPASRSRRPTRSTSSTPPGRPGSRRGSSATTAATRSRSRGR